MNLIILGQQGSGKGTQAEMLVQKYNLEHFDTGRALRQIAMLKTSLGKEVYDIVIVKKELVPGRILKEVLRIRLNDLEREQGIVFDGFPRNMEQAEYFDETLRESGRKIDKIFFVNIPEKETIARISKRWICRKCKKVLIMGKDVQSEKDKCPACGEEIAQRADDTPEGIKIRLRIFKEETAPVVEYYRKKGLLVEIDGMQPIEKVFQNIEKYIS